MIHDLWYKTAVIYCLNVETYLDSNGDGIGDFPGLTERLPYLAGLGVTCLWLLPFYPSPNKDDGYDVADFYGVHPRVGSFGDFVEFMNQAHALGLRVIVDLVINHTSDQHPWFSPRGRIALAVSRLVSLVEASARGLEHRDGVPRRAEGDVDPRCRGRRVLLPSLLRFPAGSERAASRGRGRNHADHGLLAAAWRLGVPHGRGAVRHREQGRAREPGKNFDLLHDMRDFLQWRCRDAIMLAEANVPPDESLEYFGERETGCR